MWSARLDFRTCTRPESMDYRTAGPDQCVRGDARGLWTSGTLAHAAPPSCGAQEDTLARAQPAHAAQTFAVRARKPRCRPEEHCPRRDQASKPAPAVFAHLPALDQRAIEKSSPNRWLAYHEMDEWHYMRAVSDSADPFSGSADCGADARPAMDSSPVRFGDSGFAHMQQRAAVAPFAGRAHPTPGTQRMFRRVAQLSMIPAALSSTRRR